MILNENAKAQAVKFKEASAIYDSDENEDFDFDDVDSYFVNPNTEGENEDDDEYEDEEDENPFLTALSRIMKCNDISELRKEVKVGDIHFDEISSKDGDKKDKNTGIFFAYDEDYIFSVNGNTITGIGNQYEAFHGLAYSRKRNLILGMGCDDSVLWDATTMEELMRT